MKTTAIILAAGSGSRMQSEIPKQFMELCGKPVIYYSLQAFSQSTVDEIVLVTSEPYLPVCETIKKKYDFEKIAHIVIGGTERYLSVYNGLLAAADADYVLIHDGARPLITPPVIEAAITQVMNCEACIVAVPAKDTIKIADESGMVTETPDRKRMWQVQTPQAFSAALLRQAYQGLFDAKDTAVTDDAMIVERYGNHKVSIVPGIYENIKITTPEDLLIAKVLLEKDCKKPENPVDRNFDSC